MANRERLQIIYQRSLRALQDVVRELGITEDELKTAGRYFNRLGQSGMFPSLMAVGFAMTSIDAARNAASGTRPNLEGPYYTPGAPLREDGVLYEHAPGADAQLLMLGGRVLDAAGGSPITGAELDFWQADENGKYDNEGFHLRGILRSDAEGAYRLHTVVPRDYSDHDHDPVGELFSAMGRHSRRAAHIHLKARASGYAALTTQVFVPWSGHLADDYVEGAVTPDLTLSLEERPRGGGLPTFAATFDIRLERRP